MVRTLIPSSVGKVRSRTSQKNSYGLMPGPEGSCPHATFGKGGCMEVKDGNVRPVCYVYRSFRNKAVKTALEHNTNLMKQASQAEMVAILDEEFSRFERVESKSKDPCYMYRLHWSGDIFSARYAKAIAKAVKKHPDTTFWIYTRSLPYVKHIAGVDNLTVYISVDEVNCDKALEEWKKHDNTKVKLAHMSIEKPKSASGRAFKDCPTDVGRLPYEKACTRCQLCIKGDVNIWFKTKK